MLPSMFDHPFFTITTDGESRTPSRALYKWERLKKAITHAEHQIAEWEEHKKNLMKELSEHKDEAKEFFKELLD